MQTSVFKPKYPIKIIIADDHELFANGLSSILKQLNNIQLLGVANNGQTLLQMAIQYQPDIIITDISMPLLDGFAVTKEINRRNMNCGVIVLSVFDKEEAILKMIESGALGYLLKTSEISEIYEAIYAVYQKKSYYCKGVSEKLTNLVSTHIKEPKNPELHFSEREKEIIRLICKENTSKQIAYNLHLSKRTIEGHRTRIMDKIRAKSIAGIITYAVEKGIYSKNEGYS